MNGCYDQLIDDQLNNFAAQLDYLTKNKINPTGWDYDIVYASNSEVNDPRFADLVFQAYLRKIKIGVAFSTDGEVDNAIAYNNRQTDWRKKLYGLRSEAEDYSGQMTSAEFKRLMETNYPKCRAAGMLFEGYQGWTKQYEMVVRNTDSLYLHAYIPSPDYEKILPDTGKKDYLYKYVAGYDDAANKWNTGRLQAYALQAKAQQKIYPVSILFSAEIPPANEGKGFGGDYYRTHNWIEGYNLFMDSYNRYASPEMKQWLIMDGCYIFATKQMKVVRP